ncbi:hypothetical protein [Mycetocola saprophilus]|uniref:hypothetical protein n=1 Tax=Mycetocola saprophilus TaxID=76636 RepID=UPI003BF072B7
MDQPDERVDIPGVTERLGKPVHAVYHLIQTGQVSSENIRAPGRDGLYVLKHMIRVQDIDANDQRQTMDEHVAAIRAAVVPLSPTQIYRIRRALESGWRSR